MAQIAYVRASVWLRSFLSLAVVFVALSNPGHAAEKVEAAPGIFVSLKKYNGNLSEQPFFGFQDPLVKLQERFAAQVSGLITAAASRETAIHKISDEGLAALAGNDFITAGKRFNTAYLIDPSHSIVFHNFALLVEQRFQDFEYAEELYDIAKTRPGRLPSLNAAHGRLL